MKEDTEKILRHCIGVFGTSQRLSKEKVHQFADLCVNMIDDLDDNGNLVRLIDTVGIISPQVLMMIKIDGRSIGDMMDHLPR